MTEKTILKAHILYNKFHENGLQCLKFKLEFIRSIFAFTRNTQALTIPRTDPTKRRKENHCGRCIVFYPKKICKGVRFNANLVIIRLLYALHPFLKNTPAQEHNLSKKKKNCNW